MTFALNQLTLVSPGAAGGDAAEVNNLYHFATNDTKATVEGTGYFDTIIDRLNIGDLIKVSGDLDGTPWTVEYIVASVTTHVGITPAANLSFHAAYNFSASLVPVTDGTYYLGTAPIAGTIDAIYSIVSGSIATNDAVLTFKINGTTITSGAITIANSGSAAGDQDSSTPSALKTVAAGDKISVVVSGTPGSSRTAQINMLITPT